MKKIIGYFFQGLLYIVPIIVTIYVIVALVRYVDKIIDSIPYFSQNFGGSVIGAIIIVVLTTPLGYLIPVILKTPLASLLHQIVNSTPLVGLIYSSVKDLMSAFVGKKRKFGTPVLVNMDNDNIMHRLGFITQESLSLIGTEGMVAVYMPSSYGLLGDLVIVPANKISKLNEPSADIMKFIVSGGVTKMNE